MSEKSHPLSLAQLNVSLLAPWRFHTENIRISPPIPHPLIPSHHPGSRGPTVSRRPGPELSSVPCSSARGPLRWTPALRTGSAPWWRRASPRWCTGPMAPLLGEGGKKSGVTTQRDCSSVTLKSPDGCTKSQSPPNNIKQGAGLMKRLPRENENCTRVRVLRPRMTPS